MDDTSNWEYAAAVGAICIGLGGLLLFALVTAWSHWRVLRDASRAARDAASASAAIEELSRTVQARLAAQAAGVEQGAGAIEALRRQSAEIAEQQARLQEALRHLSATASEHDVAAQVRAQQLEAAVRRLDQHLNELAAAVANATARRG